jgi:hypothetical protein
MQPQISKEDVAVVIDLRGIRNGHLAVFALPDSEWINQGEV